MKLCTSLSPLSLQEAIQLDGEILHALTRRVSPITYRHLEKHKIEPILYMTEWFMCAFSRTLPWASVLRVWDMFLCDGSLVAETPTQTSVLDSFSYNLQFIHWRSALLLITH